MVQHVHEIIPIHSHFFHELNQCREQQFYLKSLYSRTVNICKLCYYMPCKTSYLGLCTTVRHTASQGGREVFLSLFYRKLRCGTGRAELRSALINSYALIMEVWVLIDVKSTVTSFLAAGAQPGAWDPGSLPRLGDTTAAFLFAGLNNSKAEHYLQRHTGRTVTQLVTQAVVPRICKLSVLAA